MSSIDDATMDEWTEASRRIMNGDQLQFELDNANVPVEERADWPFPSFNAWDWAVAFNKQFPSVSADDALPWFAGALMRGYDEVKV